MSTDIRPLGLGAERNDVRELLTLALPIIGMTVTRMLMGFIDFAMVSQLGAAAQAAISPVTLLVFTFACIGMGAASSVQTFVSQADGRGEPGRAGAYAWQVYYIAAAFALLVTPFALTTGAWYGWIVAVGNTPPDVAAAQLDYLRIAIWSVPLAILSQGLDAFFNGVHRPRVALIASLLSLVVNVLGNYVLIFGEWGFPRMEMAGAALATVIAWGVRAGVLTAALMSRELDERYATRRSIRLNWREQGDIWRIGWPTALTWVLDLGSWVVFLTMIMPHYGTSALAASNVAIQYMHLAFMPAIGVGIALCSQVGFAIGEKRLESALGKTRVAMKVTAGYMCAIALLFVLFGGPLMGLLASDPEVIAIGRLVLIWVAIFQLFDAMCITYMNSLRGAGDTRWPAIATIVCCWVIFVLGAAAALRFLPQVGLHGPWLACVAYLVVLGLALRSRWLGGAWREIRLFGEGQTDGADGSDVADGTIDGEPAPGPPTPAGA